MKIFSCFFLCFFVIVEILFASSACAISDKEYAWCKKVSPEFAQSENDINSLWKQLNSLIKNNEIKLLLLKNQREWLKERDENYVDEKGNADVTNFTYFTKKRIAELLLYKEYVKNNYLPIKVSGKVIEQAEGRYDEDTAYYLYTKLKFNENEYEIWTLLCSSDDKKKHNDVDKILRRAEKNENKCSILVDYDILREIRVMTFVNPAENEKCSLQW